MKWYSLIDKVWRPKNLELAAELVVQNAGAAGIDKQTVKEFLGNKDIQFQEITRLLQEKRYVPQPVRSVGIPKDNGKTRFLGIPTVRDRVIQQSTRIVMEPIFEPKFKDCSYGFRPNRNCHQALDKIQEYVAAGNLWAAEFDIEAFFDSIDHELLIDFVAEEISDGSFLKLIRSFLTAGVMKAGVRYDQDKGTPQGGVISPLLANIYLHLLDEVMTANGFNLVRYADDYVVLCKTEEEADKAIELSNSILGKLKLKANSTKTRKVQLTDRDGFEFLGFLITAKYRFPRKKAIAKFRENVRRKTRRLAPVSLKEMIKQLNPTIRGWGNYFKAGNSYGAFQMLDSWTRMRLRCFIEKCKSKNANYRLTNKFFEENGLFSLFSLLKPAPCQGAMASESRMR